MSLVTDLEPLLDGSPLRLSLPNLSDDRFAEFCRRNTDMRVEQDAEGVLLIMSPTFSQTGIYSGRLFRQLDEYCENSGNGYAFDSSSGFTLPNGARRSPDASWITSSKWEALSEEQQNSFAPICPDVVIELLSSTDSLREAQAKMEEYLRNGSRLGFLIDRKSRIVFVYKLGEPLARLTNPSEVSAEPIMPSFTLKTARIF